MNKKFLSAIMFGALMTASTGVFVSCEDYGDDIAHLQEQIDQNAAASTSALAEQVAALEAQLSTLKAAQEDLTQQLADAKAEAATATNNALAAAQAAAAAAEKAQSGADEAKAAAATAQAAADKANDALAAALVRVATLETKVANLESVVADLTAAKNELSNKINELQTLTNELKNSTATNSAQIADLVAKTTALNTQIAEVSASLGARIDAINAELNNIKNLYATKDELKAQANELAKKDAELQAQISTNLKAIELIQASVATINEKLAELAAADQALAAKYDAIKEAMDAKFAAVSAELATISSNLAVAQTNIAALQEAVKTLSAQYAALETSKASKAELAEVKASLEALIASLSERVKALEANVTANTASISANKDAINALIVKVEKLTDRVTVLETKAAELENLINTNKEAADKADAQLQANIDKLNEELSAEIAALQDDLDKQVAGIRADLTAAVADLQKQIDANAKAIADNKKELEEEMAAMEATLKAEDEKLQNQIDAHEAAYLALVGRMVIAEAEIDSLSAVVAGVEADLAAKYTELLDMVKVEEAARIAAINALAADMDELYNANLAKINENVAAIAGNATKISANEAAIAANNAKIDGINATIEKLWANFDNYFTKTEVKDVVAKVVQDQADATHKEMMEQFAIYAQKLTDVELELTDLIGQTEEELRALIEDHVWRLKDAIAKAEANIKTLLDWKAAHTEEYAEYQKTINAQVADIQAGLEELQATLADNVNALLSRLQSVVFIPQYMDANNVVITPIYAYTNATFESDGETAKDVPAIFKMNFRVKPAELVDDLIGLFNADSAIVKLYIEEALQTRAADKESAKVLSIEQDENDLEVITVTASAPRLGSQLDDEKAETAETKYYPATLAIAAENSKSDFTTEYFNLVERSLNQYLPGTIYPEEDVDTVKVGDEWMLDLCYVDIDTVRNVLEETYVEYAKQISDVYPVNMKFIGGYHNENGELYKYADAERWKTFVDYAKRNGFAFHDGAYTFDAADINGKAIHAKIGNTMTLLVADETYGYDNAGMPNVSYEVTYVITPATADDAYEFGVTTKVWDAETGSDAFVLYDTLALEAFTVRGVPVADAADLETALAAAYAANDYNATYGALDADGKITNDHADGFDFVLTFSEGNAIIAYRFPEATNYNVDRGVDITVNTIYGKVKFNGYVDLAYPTDFLVHEPRFTEGVTGDFIVEAGNQVVINDGVPAYRDGKVGSSLPAAYTNYALYNALDNVEYTFTFTGAEATEMSIAPVTFSNGFASDAYLQIISELANEEGVVVTATVTVDGHEVATESYGIDVLYPVEGEYLQLNGDSPEEQKQVILASSLYNNQTVSVVGNVYLEDRYHNVLVEDGEFVERAGEYIPTNARVWGISGLEYELKDAISDSGNKVTSVSVSKDGKLSIVDPNISEDVIVTVIVRTVGYYYGVVDGEFEVLIQQTYGEYPADGE